MDLTDSKWITVGDREVLMDGGGNPIAQAQRVRGKSRFWEYFTIYLEEWKLSGTSPGREAAKAAAERALEAR